MANSQGITGEFKKKAMAGLLDGKTGIKAALYFATASIGPATAAYTTSGEVTGTGYSAKGVAVTNANNVATSSQIAYWTPSASVVYSTVTIATAFDCVLFFDDAHTADLTIGAYTFGSTTVGGGNFTLTMPTNNSTSALVRIN